MQWTKKKKGCFGLKGYPMPMAPHLTLKATQSPTTLRVEVLRQASRNWRQKPAAPNSSGTTPQRRSASHVARRKKAEDTQARTMERTHSYRKRHQRTGVYTPHASPLLQCTDPCNAPLFSPPLLRQRGKDQKRTRLSPTCLGATKVQQRTETFFAKSICLRRTHLHHSWCVCEQQTLFPACISLSLSLKSVNWYSCQVDPCASPPTAVLFPVWWLLLTSGCVNLSNATPHEKMWHWH